MRGENLDECGHIVAELPQPWPMTLVDVKLWILKLFRLHPETQDLQIKGFFKEFCPDFFDIGLDDHGPDFYSDNLDWEVRGFHSDRSWTSFVNKMKRKKAFQQLMLYADCSELKHYDVLLKAIPEGYSQLSTVLLPLGKVSDEPLRLRSLHDHLLPMTVKEISTKVADECGEQFSLPEVWRAKQKAFEFRFGTYYDSYDYVPTLLKDIVCSNPGSFFDIKDTEVVGCKDFRVLNCIFWALAQCIRAFSYCRPVLCVKGTPLCGRYQGVLLTALALDANDCLVPVAFAIAERETKESWLWFLRNVKRAVVKERSGVCIIHDCKVELVNAVDDIQNNPDETHPWRDVQSRWCMLHLAENFLEYFSDKKLVSMFKRLCQQKQHSKFAEIWKELDELTSKYMAEKESSSSQEMLQGSGELDEAELEAPAPCSQLKSVQDGEEGNHRDDSQMKITKFSDWIHLKPKEKWSLLHDTNRARYGIMGTDISDIYKHSHVFKGVPLCAIVEVTFKRMVEYFKNTSDAANKAINDPAMKFPQRVQDEMDLKMQKAQAHQVICVKTKCNNVILGDDVKQFVVQSGQKRVVVRLYSKSTSSVDKFGARRIRKSAACSCNKMQLLRKPCSHVVAVCCQIGVTSTYMSPYYSLTCLGNTWSTKFKVADNLFKYRESIQFSWEKKTLTWMPDKKLECGFPGFLTSDCTQTATEEEEQE